MDSLLVPFVIVAVWAFAFARNTCVFEVRTRFIFSGERGIYDRLPGYHNMVWNPLHWRRWTRAQWRAYVANLPSTEKEAA